MVTLNNGQFEVIIAEEGAEVVSFRSLKTGTEYIWKGDPAVWKRHAPILFPIVGRLKDKTYTVNGKAYSITQHGFGRDLPWQHRKVEGNDNSVEFLLQQNEFTKTMYPWDFTCIVRYTLDGSTLTKAHCVVNNSDTALYYELGGHDGYSICLFPDEKITDYYVEFEGTETLHPIVTDESVMLTQEHGNVPLKNGRLYLTHETFRNDALMLEDLPVRRATIGSDTNDRRVTMDFSDFAYFAVWSAYKEVDAPFVCLEPWSTLPDGKYLGHELEKKVGVRMLKPGERETLCFATTITE